MCVSMYAVLCTVIGPRGGEDGRYSGNGIPGHERVLFSLSFPLLPSFFPSILQLSYRRVGRKKRACACTGSFPLALKTVTNERVSAVAVAVAVALPPSAERGGKKMILPSKNERDDFWQSE